MAVRTPSSRASSSWFLGRFFCTNISGTSSRRKHKWSVKQVFKSNFGDSLEEFKSRVSDSDYVAVSLRKTGSFSNAWHRVSAFDTVETAYLKAKHAAEKFQVLQFAVCPFTVRDSKVVAHPYNFHLFPRDELKVGMPSYSFFCQSSYLASMAREGFDFNACIYDGISYLSRQQESAARIRLGKPSHGQFVEKSSSTSVSDAVFLERIKSRIKQWRSACEDSRTRGNDPLLMSLKKVVLGSEEFRSRPSLTIDVCSEQQVQLTLEVLAQFSEDLVPLIIPAKSGGTWAVRVVLTSSKQDKDLLEEELRILKDEESKKLRGFREVIDLISAARKPIVSRNSLNDFTFIHSMFLAPLPANVDDFLFSLSSVFPQIFDINHLMNEISLVGKPVSAPAALSYLNNRFFVPSDMEVSLEVGTHEHNIVSICHLFAKLCSMLKLSCKTGPSDGDDQDGGTLEGFANVFKEQTVENPSDESIRDWMSNTKRVSTENMVFLWGFRKGVTAKMLKDQLHQSHVVFSGEFDVRLVDKSCAIVVFWQPGLSDTFLSIMNSGDISGSLMKLVSEGLKAAGYKRYMRVCRLHLLEAELADAFDKTADVCGNHSEEDDSVRNSSEIHWHSEVINLDVL